MLKIGTPTLGWLRVLLALMVIDFHYGFFYGHIGPILIKYLGPLAWLHDGILAVFGFFILSGYLIADMVEVRYPIKNGADFGHFLLGRYARIYPLYWIVLAACIVALGSHQPDWPQIIANFLLFPYGFWSFFMNHKQFGALASHLVLSPAWTLSLDLVFYPIGAVLVISRKFLPVLVGICIAFVVLASWKSPLGIGDIQYNWWRVQFYTSIEPNLLAFLSGLLIRLKGKSLPRPSWLAATAFFIMLYTAYVPWGLGYSSVYFLYIAALTWLVHHLCGAGRGPYEAFLGNWTYSIYLIHIPIETLTIYLFSKHLGHLEITSFLTDITLASLIAVFIETPLEKFRHLWLKSLFLQQKKNPKSNKIKIPWNYIAATMCCLCFLSTYWYVLIEFEL
ncbi:MAG: acyltransferase family protein [Leptospirales bacterium]